MTEGFSSGRGWPTLGQGQRRQFNLKDFAKSHPGGSLGEQLSE